MLSIGRSLAVVRRLLKKEASGVDVTEYYAGSVLGCHCCRVRFQPGLATSCEASDHTFRFRDKTVVAHHRWMTPPLVDVPHG